MKNRIRLSMLMILALCRAGSASEDLTELEERAMQAAVRRIAPSVVRIETFGGQERVGQILVSQAPTTGLAVAEEGYVISSAFNFIQQPASILVTLPSGKRAAAEIVSRDHSTMLVLLKVSSDEPLVPAAAVPAEAIQVGQWALAVGRTHQADHPSVSVGIISAENRIWGKAIQTDAKISPRNYGGPLVDISGRVLGVLVPLSPQGQSEIAGAEWYDSGIGFAISLSGIYGRLERMKQGDLQPGVLGISLSGSDPYSGPVEIAACQARSPAYVAGLRAGDEIVRLEGVDIQRPSQLKHVLGTKYAGDEVQLVALRAGERIDVTVELTDKLEPYAHPFLGVLPRRDSSLEEPGTVIRYVYTDGGAATSGLRADDRIISLNNVEIENAAALRLAIANHEPGETVAVGIARDGTEQEFTVKLGALPTDIPPSLPPARTPLENLNEPPPAGGVIEIKVPEEPNECFAYVPEHYDARISHGVVVYLIAPGAANRDKLVATWKTECDRRNLILLVPQPRVPTRWFPTEVGFIRKALDQISDRFHVDARRIVVCGDQAGGALAYLVAFRQRDVVRGVATLDAALSPRFQPPHNDPVQRLAIYMTMANKSPLANRIRASAERLGEMKYPVTLKHLGDAPRGLNQTELAELARWIDTLDRL